MGRQKGEGSLIWIWAIIILIIILVLLVLGCLFIPLKFSFYLDTNGSPPAKIRISWFFGTLDKVFEPKPKKIARVWIHGRKRASRPITVTNIVDEIAITRKVFRIKGLTAQIGRMISGLFRSLKIEYLKTDIKFEIANPLYAGIAYAAAAPVNYFLKRLPYEVSIWPSFTTRYFADAEVQVTCRARPISALFPVVRFALSSPAIQAYKILSAAKWKKQK